MINTKKNKKLETAKYDPSKGDDQYFLRNPTLYKPGMDNAHFSGKLMVQWIIYSFVHAFWVF